MGGCYTAGYQTQIAAEDEPDRPDRVFGHYGLRAVNLTMRYLGSLSGPALLPSARILQRAAAHLRGVIRCRRVGRHFVRSKGVSLAFSASTLRRQQEASTERNWKVADLQRTDHDSNASKGGPAANTPPMKVWEKVMLAGLGGLVPAVANAYLVDLRTVFSSIDMIACGAWVVKIILLFGTGCLIGWVYKEEKNRLALFQLGMGVPALLLSAVNGAQVPSEDMGDQPPPVVQGEEAIGETNTPGPIGAFWSSFQVYARDNEFSFFKPPRESSTEKWWRGFGFKLPPRDHYVIAGAYRTAPEARGAAKELENAGLGFRPRVFAPPENDSFYSVVLAEHVTKDQAEKLYERCVRQSDRLELPSLSQALVWRWGDEFIPLRSWGERERSEITTGNTDTKVRDGWWRWTVFLSSDNRQLLGEIECVQYTLHPTFPNPVQRICSRGAGTQAFRLSGQGWGTFAIDIRVFFKDGTTTDLEHRLVFRDR